MRNWVEKIARLIETEGKKIGRFSCKVLDYEIWFASGERESYVSITNETTKEHADVKLYEEEKDVIKKALDRCKEKTTNSIIDQLNNL
jgi:hypothetical protein